MFICPILEDYRIIVDGELFTTCSKGFLDGAISPDKPLPDESGFWRVPPTPRNPYPYRILYTDKSRPLRPSDFGGKSPDNSVRGERGSSSSERTLTDSDDDSGDEAQPLLGPYAWVTVLIAASATCLLSLVLVMVVSHRTLKSPTSTSEEPAVFIDPVEFVARAGLDQTTDEGVDGTTTETTVAAPTKTEGPRGV
ncbi:hypothetical protein HPB52_007810 [Rhipicephalus sanguineus]|uniref:Uncharacterized protein n=1 Tax=Rhipicephalus sanguineus TaxID=34632 RepID=A0A9D4PHP6_RHISA|nr:hypothetical protein HPB52_007810 [Rhipicephalus sanguineus]